MEHHNRLYGGARKTHTGFPLIANAYFSKEITVNTENECHQTSCQPAQKDVSRLKGTPNAFYPQGFGEQNHTLINTLSFF